jgi:hypothetical protein
VPGFSEGAIEFCGTDEGDCVQWAKLKSSAKQWRSGVRILDGAFQLDMFEA